MSSVDFGNFAGSFANAFSQTQQALAQQKSQREINKLQARLIEAQLNAQALQQEALGEVTDRMGATRLGEFNIGPRTPVEGMPGLERPNITNPAAESNARGPQDLMSILTDASMADVQGLLITSGLLKPADIMRFQTEKDQLEQQKDIFERFSGMLPEGGDAGSLMFGGATIDPRGGIGINITRNPDVPTPQGFSNQVTDAQSLITEANKAIPAMMRLENTPLAIGTGSDELRKKAGYLLKLPETMRGPAVNFAAKQYGMSPDQFYQMLTDYDDVVKAFGAIGSAAISTASNQYEQQAIMQGLPETSKTPDANIGVIVQHLGRQIERLRNTGQPVPPELIDAYEAFVSKYGKPQASSGGLILGYFTEAEWNALTPEEQAEAQGLLGGGR